MLLDFVELKQKWTVLMPFPMLNPAAWIAFFFTSLVYPRLDCVFRQASVIGAHTVEGGHGAALCERTRPPHVRCCLTVRTRPG